jgi:hypothetical protein
VPENCSIVFEKAECLWDETALNYSVNAQVAWSGGAFAKISAAGLMSRPLTAKPALFHNAVSTSGTKSVSATVYDATEAPQCTTSTSVTCVRPEAQAAPSPVTGALPITGATASSAKTGNEAAKAIDGDQFTAWQSDAPFPQWLKVDLGLPRTIRGVGIYSTVGRPTDFKITTSLDDVTYSFAGIVSNANYSSDWNVTMFSVRDARYVILNVTAAEQNTTYIYEFKVYSGEAPTTELPITIPTVPAAELPLTFIAIVSVVALTTIGILLAYRRRIALWWGFVRG